MKKIFLFITILLASQYVIGQNLPCTGGGPNGAIQILGDDINFCNDGVHLYLNFTGTAGVGYPSTSTYNVVQNAYAPSPFSGGTNVQTLDFSNSLTNLTNIDDRWSIVYPLPFKFCFMGQQYNYFIVGNNGQVGFDTSQANQFNPFANGSYSPLPFSSTAMNNCIMAPYYDIYPPFSSTSQITFQVYGTAPCRKLVVSWLDNPQFSCNSNIATQQIVMYESTNEIEINILSKPLCAAWQNGLAFEGIQNQSATVAFSVPGRNGTAFTAFNDSYSFVPAGPVMSVSSNIYWMDSATNTCLDTGATYDAYPAADMAVYVIVGDTTAGSGCGNIISPYKHLYVNTVIPNFTYAAIASCNGGIATFTNTSLYATSYLWDFGDGTTSTAASPVHTYTSLGPFTATLNAISPGCSTVVSQSIVLTPTPVIAAFTATPDSLCSGSQVSTNNTSSGLGISYLWNMGDGTTYSTQNVTHTYTQAISGNVTITLTVIDQFGCVSTKTKVIWIDGTPMLKASSDRNVACVGDLIKFDNQLSANILSYQWNMGDTRILINENDPSYSYPEAGNYKVVLSGTYAKCPARNQSIDITVIPYPILDLGGAQIICPGKDKITLTDNFNVGQPITYLWSTGETGNSIVVKNPGIITLIANIGTCSTSVVKEILGDIDCIYQPNAFTPNGDNRNDYFKPIFFDESDITFYEMVIYNRWGEEIYKSVNKSEKGWDGLYKGKKCDFDTYIYVLTMELKDGTKKTFKRDVLLMR
jgi:gliding motility-associated-like protein